MARLRRRTKVAHVAREDFEERANLIKTELDSCTFLLRTTYLASYFRVEAFPKHFGAATGQLEQDRDLPMGDRECDAKRDTTAQFEQLDVVTLEQVHRAGDQRGHGRVGPEWATVVHEGHRDQVVAEQSTPHSHERKDTRQLLRLVSRG